MKMRNVPIAGVAFALTALARLPQTTGGDFLEVEIIKASANCDEAAAQIQKARHNFNSPPGPYIKNAPPFDEMENISLVALYNPKENAELDCYYLSCLQDEDSSNPIRVRGLICASSPVALEQGKQPFTQEEFTRIETAEAFARSAASLVPIASMVAAVAACMLLAFE
ncbi:hypothetical protein ACSSS7_003002 [Eimeria intestinalis]